MVYLVRIHDRQSNNIGAMAQNETVGTMRPPPYSQQHRQRPRVPQAYGIVDCIKRSLGVLLDTFIIVINIRFSVMQPERAGFGAAGILGGFMALLLDGSDVVGTLDRSRRIARPSAPLTFSMDIVILIIFIIDIVVFLFGVLFGLNLRQPPSWKEETMLCFWMTVAGA
ncbi:unnamed protein product [Clonostachys rosea]|uniref:MARVEL domain-containing protein n=1 Tax=Bionectria ochroleuca TaxID=29856 RepID=A0ABY6UH49_BIOOC|nr:unnamed protein product [Clonostachys rosea]